MNLEIVFKAVLLRAESLERKNAMSSLTRRRFVRSSVAGAATGLLVGIGANTAHPSSEPMPWLPRKWDREADVVVVGSGYAGSNAAIASHDGGSKVLILEKAPEQFAGGNSAPVAAHWIYLGDRLHAGCGAPVWLSRCRA